MAGLGLLFMSRFDQRSFVDDRSERSKPTGDGSRGGRYHEPEYRKKYHRAWRAAHPEYRERERLRRARKRAAARGEDASLIIVPPSLPRPLPVSAGFCECDCQCGEHIVIICGFCLEGLHRGHAAKSD